jgi:replicative DNA helicase
MSDRTLPHDLEAEKALLGAILMHEDALFDVAGLVSAAEFFRAPHRRIFAAFEGLAAKKIAIDFLTLKERLAAAGELEEVGGQAYLASLTDGRGRTSHAQAYAGIIREKARLRDLIYGANKLLAHAYDAEQDAATILDTAEQTLFELSRGERRGGFKQLKDIIPGVMDHIEHWVQMKTGVSGVSSGFLDLDQMTRGFQPGNLVILAARPSMGKSALAMNIAQHVAGAGQAVGFFSLEMSEHELGVRTLTAAAGVDGHWLQRGRIRESEWGRLSMAIQSLSALPLFIDESPFITAFEMRSRARRLKAEHGLALLIVDYTQLMLAGEGDRRENRTLELAGITRALKGLAKDLKIPVIALSQLSRRVEERQDKRPMLSDLRESGSLEQDADVVLFIYREAVYKETDENRRRAELIIGKQRNGPIGTIRLGWIPEETKFVNYAEVTEPVDHRLPLAQS